MSNSNAQVKIDTAPGITAMRDLRKEINNLRGKLIELDEDSQEYADTLSEVANKTFQLREINEQVRYTVTDIGEQLKTVTRIGTGVASGFSVIQGTMKLFGGESELLQESMLKVQSAIAIVQGLEGLEGLGKTLKIAKIQFSGTITTVKTFIKSLSGVKTALLGTGIGAFIVLIGTLIANWDKVSEMFNNVDPIEKTKKALEGLNATYEANNSTMQKANSKAYAKYIENLKAVKGDAEATARVMEAYNQELKDNERQLLINNKLEAELLRRQASTDFAIVKAAGFKESSKQYKEAQQNLENAVIAADKAQMELAKFEGKDIEEQAKATIEANKKKIESDKQAAAARIAIEKQLAQQRANVIKSIKRDLLPDDETRDLIDLTNKFNEYTKLFEGNEQALTEIKRWYENERLKIVTESIDAEIEEYNESLLESEDLTAERIASIIENSRKRIAAKMTEINRSEDSQLYTIEREKPSSLLPWGNIDTEIAKIDKVKGVINQVTDLKIAAIQREMDVEGISLEYKAELSQQEMDLTNEKNKKLSELDGQRENAVKNRTKTIASFTASTFQAAFSATSDLISALSANIDTTTEEGFEKNKVLQKAQTWMNVASGIVSAISTGFQLGPIAGPIVGALNAATVLASGVAQINNINKQQFDKASAIGDNATTTPNVASTMLPTAISSTALSTDTETSLQNSSDIQVYVLESDITKTQNDVKTKVEESTF